MRNIFDFFFFFFFFSFFKCFFFFFQCFHPHRSCKISLSSGNTRSLTHCARPRPELELVSQHSKTPPIPLCHSRTSHMCFFKKQKSTLNFFPIKLLTSFHFLRVCLGSPGFKYGSLLSVVYYVAMSKLVFGFFFFFEYLDFPFS